MVLFAIVGELGAGKTTCSTFLAWKNWFFRKKKIYSNYHLFKIPYILVDSIQKMTTMRDGYVVMDELWRYCDSRLTKSQANKITSDILSRSRKRHLTYVYTAQLIESIDKRVRKVTDFTALPLFNIDETICKVIVFRTGYPSLSNRLKVFYFKTGLVFKMFSTDEEIEMAIEDEFPDNQKIIFQENYNPDHGFLCECNNCNTKFFKTWEEADSYGEKYWREKIRDLSKLI